MNGTADNEKRLEPILTPTDENSPGPPVKHTGVRGILDWYWEWALPGLGMFSEAYIIFSAGQIKPLQQGLYPTCFNTDLSLITDCDAQMVSHVSSYIQICGIMAGMLLWGFLGDFTGRKWGSRCVAGIMLTGCILLVFSPYAGTPYGYFVYFMVAQTWYGFGVGGEYPMASSSAAERASTTPELRNHRGRQVMLVFSNQGMGNLVNGVVIVVAMAIFGQTGDQSSLTFQGCRNVLALVYGIGALVCLFMVIYRSIYLHESKMFDEVSHIHGAFAREGTIHYKSAWRKHGLTWFYFWPRQLVASGAWIAIGFDFYGNKLQQTTFLELLFPHSTPYVQLQWSIFNSFISLLGYYAAAWLVDKAWYGRRRMQIVGFMAIFVFYIIIYAQWDNMGAPGATSAGLKAFQALYYLSSFFCQFGPNATTWLVAGEIFPTDTRTTMHGLASTMGKLGAIIAALWISYISDKKQVFLISAMFAIGGALVTYIWLPDTTGLELEENDRMQRYILEGRFKEYHGEAVNPKHLSPWEIYVLGWHKVHDESLDRHSFKEEVQRMSRTPHGQRSMARMKSMAHVLETQGTSLQGNSQRSSASGRAGEVIRAGSWTGIGDMTRQLASPSRQGDVPIRQPSSQSGRGVRTSLSGRMHGSSPGRDTLVELYQNGSLNGVSGRGNGVEHHGSAALGGRLHR